MKKLWIAAGVLIAVVITCAVAAPYWSGAQIERHFRELVAASENIAGFPTDIQSYQRGVTESQAVTVTTITIDEGETFDLVFDHRIDHGPTLGQSAAARIESTLRLPEAGLEQLQASLAGESPLTVVVLVHADGSQDIEISAPKFEVEDVDGSGDRLVFGGLSGRGKVTQNTDSVALDVSVPSINVIIGDADLMVSDIKGSTRPMPTDNTELWLGDGDVTVAKLTLVPADGNDLVPVVADGLRFTTSVKDVEGGIDIKSGYAVETLVVAGETISNIVLDFGIGAIDRGALERYVETAHKMKNEMATPQDERASEAMANELLANGMQVLTIGQPTARLNSIGFSYGDGRMDGNGSVRYVGGGDVASFNPFTDVTAALSLKGSKELVSAIMAEVLATQQYGGRLASLPEQARNAVVGATQFQLDAVIKQGMVIDKGEEYAVNASFKNGQLLVNGAPTPLPIPGAAPVQ